jgi:hypothetical protein
MQLLEKKIDDTKFLNVIRKMLKAGYVEDWRFHKSHSGTPQGGIISPILANIYLHELDGYIERLRTNFNRGKERAWTPEYTAIKNRTGKLTKKIDQETNLEIRQALIDQKKDLQRQSRDIPCTDQHDPQFRRLSYCRYADDFLLSVIGPKSEAEEISRNIACFLTEELKLNTSKAKSGLKHQTEVVRFLGYDLTITHTEKIVKLIEKGRHTKRRTMKGKVSLRIPRAKLTAFAKEHGYGNLETLDALHKPYLSHASDAEITMHYSAEMRGLAQYYALADNWNSLGKLRLLWSQSYFKTLANKHKTSMQKVATMLNRGPYMAVRETKKDGKTREIKLFRLQDVKRKTPFGAEVDKLPVTVWYTKGSELLKRLDANQCEYCEKEGGYFEVHHVRKLADVQDGKQPWEKLMIARQRKTLVLCLQCHQKLTHGKLPDRRHLVK